jgi:tetratricopeptide (TPR) repeat protein
MNSLSNSLSNSLLKPGKKIWIGGLLFAIFPAHIWGQAASPAPADKPVTVETLSAGVSSAKDGSSAKEPSRGDKRRAVRLFLDASKLYEKEKFEEAMLGYQKAAVLDPSNSNYEVAAEVARGHAVTALIQAAAKDRFRKDATAERADLIHALELDPRNIEVTEHLHESGADVIERERTLPYEEAVNSVEGDVPLDHPAGEHTFHLRSSQRQAIQEVFKAFGMEVTLDESVRSTQIRLDIENANFDQAMEALHLLTHTFFVPLDVHRVLVAADSRPNRERFEHLELETIYLRGLTSSQLTEVGNLAKNIFDVQRSVANQNSMTLTLRAPQKTLNAFNSTIRELLNGRSQVMLQVQMFQLAHTNNRNTGIQPPQSISAFNVYTEEQAILNANQALVQQIISSGLVAPGDTLGILGILLASGQVSSSLFTNGIALFGGGLTESALAPGAATLNLNLNSSDSRELDDIQLRLGDGDPGTVRAGTRYPIQTASYSSGVSSNVPSIPGLTSAGASGSLTSLLSNLAGSAANVPIIDYQDLGLTLKTTANVMRNSEVALTIDMKVVALSGTSIGGNPVLNNQAYTGVLTVKQGEGVVLISNLNKQEVRAVSGVAGLSEIPGLNDVTDKNAQTSVATLLILITPHVVRGTQAAGHSPMMWVDKAPSAMGQP